MTNGCKTWSIEHGEALRWAQIALARLNLFSITILEKLTCQILMNKTRLTHMVDSYNRCGSGSSHWCQVMSGSPLPCWRIPTMTYAEIQATVVIVVGAWIWMSRYGDGTTFGCILVFLSSSSLLWISARFKCHRQGLLPPATGGGVSPWAGSAERSPLGFTDQLWDLWVRTIAYVGW